MRQIFKSWVSRLRQVTKKYDVKNRIGTFIVGAITGPLIFFLIANVVFFFKTGEFRSTYLNNEIEQYIQSEFNRQYEINIQQEQMTNFGSPSIIAYANDQNIKDFCPKEYKLWTTQGQELTLLPSVVKIYEQRSDLFYKIFPFLPPYKAVFELSPKIETDATSSLQFYTPFIRSLKVLDLDGDGKKEMVVDLMTPTCGSGAEVYNLMIGQKDGKYQVLASLPDVGYFKEQTLDMSFEETLQKALKNHWELNTLFSTSTLKSNGESLDVRSADSDDFIAYKDLDGDAFPELIIAAPIWDMSTECHWCPHKWRIGVYKYKNGEFDVDNKFNSSLLLETREKYDLYDIFGYRPIPDNRLGIVSAYYGLGYLDTENSMLDFDVRERTTSKIWKIIGEHYHLE